MIPQTKTNNILQHGRVLASNDMTIKATPEMFDLLSSGIYKNPVQAVVREYLANAVDASPNRISVTVPTQLVPYFKVRDYGEGMSTDFVMELFSSYGFSDKRTTNAAIGGFGIGSKSGYAYTDSFTVRSFCGNPSTGLGTASTYECTRSKEGKFVISLRGSKETTETGTEIIIPVKYSDFKKYQEYIEYYASFLCQFRLGLAIEGCNKPVEFTKTGDLYEMVGHNGIASSFLIVMGGIPYSADKVPSIDTHLLNKSLCYPMPIGSVPVTASRESVRLTPEAEEVLKDAIQKAIQSKVKHHQDALDAAPNEYAKMLVSSDLPFYLKHYLKGAIDKIDLDTVIYKNSNKNGALTDRHYYNKISKGIEVTLIDVDKYIPSRVRTQGCNGLFLEPKGDIKDTIKELQTKGVPYQLLSSYAQDIQPRKQRTKSTTNSVTKGEALVVYLDVNANRYPTTERYTSESTLDLDNPGDVCYYDRSLDKERVEDLLFTYPILKDMGFKCISATNKNLGKLLKANIKHVDDLWKDWLKARHHLAEPFIKAYVNEYHSNWIDSVALRRLGYIVSNYYHSGNQLATNYSWRSFHNDITSNFDPKVAEQWMEDIDKKITKMKAVEYKGVSLYDHLNWDHKLLTKLGVI